MIKRLKYSSLILLFGDYSIRWVIPGLPFGLFFNRKPIIFIVTVILFLLSLGKTGWGQSITVSSLDSTTICPDTNVTVNFSWVNMSNGNETKTFNAQYENPIGTWNSFGTVSISGSGNKNGESSITTAGPGINGTYSVRVIRTVPGPQVNSTNALSLIVSALTAPSGISASPSVVCSGSSVTLSVNNPGAGFTTDWFSGSCGGTLVGTGNSLSVSPAATTIYYARTRNTTTGCVSSTCSTVTVTVKEVLPVSVSIMSSQSGTVCTGTSVTFTATPTNGGSSPIYQWKVNGTNVGTDSNVYSYVPVNGDVVSCVLTSNAECVEGAATTPITYFSWDDNTKEVTDSDTGLDAISIGGGQYLPGGIGGTTALGPITIPKTDIVLNLGNNSAYNSEGVDYSISYRRAESASQMFTRGSSLIISGGSVFNVSYRVDNGAGSFTTMTSSNFNIAEDNYFHDYRFTYDPSDGYGRLYVDGTEVWTSAATPGKEMYWTVAEDLIIGANTDASGTLIPTFDNLSIKGISLKTAVDEVILTVNPLPVITIQPLPLIVCEGESGNFTVATSASSPAYQWGYATSPTPASWINVPEGGDISGTETYELELANILLGYNDVYVSCLITANGCETRSSAVLLTVNPLPATGEIIPD